jgi:hypothetical protein
LTPPPPFILQLLGWDGSRPNIADGGMKTSVAIATHMFNALHVTRATSLTGQQVGAELESEIELFLSQELPKLDPSRAWDVKRRRVVSDFDQYAHIARLQTLIDADTTRTLSAEIGTDYVIKPDVTVAIPSPHGPYLHAAIPCKWTMRSDRVQNVRHEGIILTRHRRGRQPHIVAVTPEPMATRIASLARGTGEVDAVYHVLFDELVAATAAVGTKNQQDALDELVTQRRLLPIAELAPTIVL